MPSSIDHYIAEVRTGELAKPRHCAICASAGGLSWHGMYLRSLITLTQTWILPVKRLYCRFCDHTFALLPCFVVKFHRYAKEVIHSALTWLKTCTYEAVAENIASRYDGPDEPNIATLTLYFWRCKFG